MKLRRNLAIAIAVAGLAIGWLYLRQWQGMSAAAPELDTVPILKTAPAVNSIEGLVQAAPVIADVAPPPPTQSNLTTTTRQGGLRVSNRSEHSVRVALLLKLPKASSPKVDLPPYEPPAHWDFAAGEGGQKGLIVSLPNRRINVKKGDVLVAFAQDGSQQYWGPYVINETPAPQWQEQTAEWELILEDYP